MESDALPVAGPYFEDLQVGPFPGRRSCSNAHRRSCGAPPGDCRRADAVGAGRGVEPARRRRGACQPGLVWDVAIGQSTLDHPAGDCEPLLQRVHVLAACLLSGIRCTRPPKLSRCAKTAARRARGNRLAVIPGTDRDQARPPVLEFYRCAMLPLRDPKGWTGRQDDLGDDSFRARPRGLVRARSRVGVWRSFAPPHPGNISPAWFPTRFGRSPAAIWSPPRRNWRG